MTGITAAICCFIFGLFVNNLPNPFDEQNNPEKALSWQENLDSFGTLFWLLGIIILIVHILIHEVFI